MNIKNPKPTKENPWNNRCKCGRYIPDEYELCDYCLLSKYNLWPAGPDCCREYGTLYKEEDVLGAIREAELNSKKNVAVLVGVNDNESSNLRG